MPKNMVSNEPMDYEWVKMKVSNREWNAFFKYDNSYAVVDRNTTGLWVGFLVPKQVLPNECLKECTEKDLFTIDDARRASSVLPKPLKDKLYDKL